MVIPLSYGNCVHQLKLHTFPLLEKKKHLMVFFWVSMQYEQVFIGISRRVLNVRPAAFFFMKCSLSSKEIQQMYSTAQDSFESTQLYTVSMVSLIFYLIEMHQHLGASFLLDNHLHSRCFFTNELHVQTLLVD